MRYCSILAILFILMASNPLLWAMSKKIKADYEFQVFTMIQSGDYHGLRKAVEQDMPLFYIKDGTGNTLLHRAIYCRNLDVLCELLMSDKAPLEVKNDGGYTPAELAYRLLRTAHDDEKKDFYNAALQALEATDMRIYDHMESAKAFAGKK